METLKVLLVTIILIINVSAYLIKVPTVPANSPSVTNKPPWIYLQKLMIPLFENVCEPSTDPTIQRLAQEFSINPNDYSVSETVTNFLNLNSSGFLPKGTIFTEYDINHMKELKVIYEVLYTANDFNTFYKSAAWARQNLNCVLYVNAIYMTVQNRKDIEQLYIPAPYELLPNYFIDKDVIMRAFTFINGDKSTSTEGIRFVGKSYIMDANYTSLFYDNEDDSKLAYFREDVGLNSYYYLRKLKMAPWFNNNINSNFGENMYQMMKQFMARYNLERYANGLPELDAINWDSLIDMPYESKLIYSDGNEFGRRNLSLKLSLNEDLLMIKAIENNVATEVSHMLQIGYNKTQILNHLIELFVTSERSYETLARHILGKDQSNNRYPSVLYHYMTTLRDPIFWKLNQRIVNLIDEALKLLPSYTRNELYFPGVEVISVDVKKMITVYDYFEFDTTEALKMKDSNSTIRLNIGQPRLNHKKFTVKVNISSLTTQKGIMKIYLGPDFIFSELAENKNLFVLLDNFEVNLKVGSNIITRSSDDMIHFSEDFLSLNAIKSKVEVAEFGMGSLPNKSIQSQTGYPLKLILPKGTPQGLPLQMFVFIAPYFKTNVGDSFIHNNMEFNTAILSPGYPLDLMIEYQQLLQLPNAMIKSVNVTQKTENKIENYGGAGITKPWNSFSSDDPNTHNSFLQSNYNLGNEEYTNKYLNSIKTNEFINDRSTNVLDENFSVNHLNIGFNNAPNIQKASQFDYASNKKGPFDYEAKKTQYKNKDISYEKNKPKFNEGPTTESINLNKNIEERGHIIENREKLNDKEFHTQTFELEPLPLPAMLTKDLQDAEKFDYKLKKAERDSKIKILKKTPDELIKDAKKKKVMSTIQNIEPDNDTQLF